MCVGQADKLHLSINFLGHVSFLLSTETNFCVILGYVGKTD